MEISEENAQALARQLQEAHRYAADFMVKPGECIEKVMDILNHEGA